MKGVWSWANHIQATHSQSPIQQSTKLLGHTAKKFRHMKFWRMKKQGLQDEGVDYSSHCMRAFVWEPSKSHTNALIQLVKFYFISF